MTSIRLAYMPLATYPSAIADDAIRVATAFAASLRCTLSVSAFAVDLPHASSGLGDLLINVPGLVKACEEKSQAEGHRLEALVRKAAASSLDAQCMTRRVAWGTVLDEAAQEARYFDLTVLPWSGETLVAQDMAHAVIFGSGRPAILVPASARPAPLDHIAIAWDGSRVAARALGDALPLLAEGGLISVLTVQGEKPLPGSDPAAALVASLAKRGVKATHLETTLGKRTIAQALQEISISSGARLLVMGGFGHSRLRDFVLGGATQGVLAHPRLPTLLAH